MYIGLYGFYSPESCTLSYYIPCDKHMMYSSVYIVLLYIREFIFLQYIVLCHVVTGYLILQYVILLLLSCVILCCIVLYRVVYWVMSYAIGFTYYTTISYHVRSYKNRI